MGRDRDRDREGRYGLDWHLRMKKSDLCLSPCVRMGRDGDRQRQTDTDRQADSQTETETETLTETERGVWTGT